MASPEAERTSILDLGFWLVVVALWWCGLVLVAPAFETTLLGNTLVHEVVFSVSDVLQSPAGAPIACAVVAVSVFAYLRGRRGSTVGNAFALLGVVWLLYGVATSVVFLALGPGIGFQKL